MIYCECHTNLDDFKNETWPTVLSCRPEIDDYIQSKNGKKLKINSITHKMCKNEDKVYIGNEGCYSRDTGYTPILLLELYR